MAAAIFRAKIASPLTVSRRRLAGLFTNQKRNSSSASTDIPLLQKLLKAPISSIQATLDSELSHDSTEFPWAALLSSLNTSAPQKANLVMEWKLEKLTKDDRKNHDCYAHLISLCENIRNLPIALYIFTLMEARGVKPTPSVFNALISTSLSSGNLLTALSLFEIMKGSEDKRPNSDTYNAFILSYANLGNKNATESWVTAKKASGFSTDAQTYGFLIQSCLKSKSFEDAQNYFDEMISDGLMPNESTFQNMLLMYCQLRNLFRVKEILRFLPNGKWRIDQNVAKRVLGFYQELGAVEELEELIVILTKADQTSEVLSLVYCSAIRLYADKDRLDDVEYSVGRMLKNGISFSCEEDVEKVICCYFRKEAHDRLDLLLECIKDSYKLTRSIYDLLGAGYRRAGLLEKLNVLMSEMKLAGFT
ncbi:pentatricopeptide repeat-containing protein at5g14770 mitochondrial [Phtheirospermum japonicum]|uniref:Pentatricopeptide repeat-containing protein at5g14770 mitochondrial n=1 Tax=Phtheirospermum japonicum TaxID=374723 RepID=A0A830DKA7_9LAMI|nr:pentatricopeptide repeat-containing protein at5g14770 mitochondrial [Phtheirospermum japonicum]